MKYLLKIMILLSFKLGAQSYKEDLNSVLNHLSTIKNYSMRVHYKLYLDNNLKKAFQESFTQIRKSEDGLFYRQSDGTEFMSNPRYDIYLDRKNGEITLRKKNKNEIQDPVRKLMEQAVLNLDSMLSIYEGIKIIKNSGSKVTYELRFKEGKALKSMTLSIDKQKNIVTNIVYRYHEKMEIAELKNSRHKTTFEISYEDIYLDKAPESSLLKEDIYISLNKGKIRPSAKYNGYSLKIIN